MADKAISELIAAEQITPTDLLVMEQNGTAKKLTGQVLINFLTRVADGHGGIQKIEKTSTAGLTDTYTITLADLTTQTFTVTNGRGITSIAKTGTQGLVDTYRIAYNDGTSYDYTVTNGAKGDKGDNAYLYIKYASQNPSTPPHSFGDVPDDWMGVCATNAASAPAAYTAYQWYKIKGEKGDIGDPAALQSQTIEYQVSDSGTIYPSGAWSQTIPVVTPGKYLWTRTTLAFNTGSPVVSYSVSRFGIDGTGAVSTVCGVAPDENGDVELAAENVGALPSTGGAMSGAINMQGQAVTGLNDPQGDTDAARKAYVDIIRNAIKSVTCTLPSAGWSSSAPYTQSVTVAGMTDAWMPGVPVLTPGATTEENAAIREAAGCIWRIRSEAGKLTFICDEEKPETSITLTVPGILEV